MAIVRPTNARCLCRPPLGYWLITGELAKIKTREYQEALGQGKARAGKNLRRRCPGGLSQLSFEQFLAALMSTRVPQIFAESQVAGDGSDWNCWEEGILGSVCLAVRVMAFDDGDFPPSPAKSHEVPFPAELLFVSEPLLAVEGRRVRPGPDLTEIRSGTKESVGWCRGELIMPVAKTHPVVRPLVRSKYRRLIAERLLPPLRYASEKALEEGVPAHVRMGGIGAGAFAGPWRGAMHQELHGALSELLAEHSSALLGISRVDLFFPETAPKDRPTPEKFGHIVVRVGAFGCGQLAEPAEGCRLYKVVAWDPFSFPGNDYWCGNSRTSDDGVAAAATDLCGIITEVKGLWEPKGRSNTAGFVAETGETWGQVAARLPELCLRVCGNLLCYSSPCGAP